MFFVMFKTDAIYWVFCWHWQYLDFTLWHCIAHTLCFLIWCYIFFSNLSSMYSVSSTSFLVHLTVLAVIEMVSQKVTQSLVEMIKFISYQYCKKMIVKAKLFYATTTINKFWKRCWNPYELIQSKELWQFTFIRCTPILIWSFSKESAIWSILIRVFSSFRPFFKIFEIFEKFWKRV